jgi:hypothetical protein
VVSDSIYRHLSTDAGVSALVSTRVFPLVIPQQTYDEVTKQPCLVYTIDTDARHVRFAGSDSLVRGSLEVDCYARSYKQVQSLAAAVRDALLDLSGSIQADTSPITYTRIQTVHLDGETSLMDEEPGLYHVLQRYVVWYDEA